MKRLLSLILLISLVMTLCALEPCRAAVFCDSAEALKDTLEGLSDEELIKLQTLLEDMISARGLGETMVWCSRTGKKYHNSSTCSNMKNPFEITLSEATERGLTPCSKCVKK